LGNKIDIGNWLKLADSLLKEVETISYYSYISFPRKLDAFLLSEIKGWEKEFGIFYDTTKYRNDIFLFPNSPPEESDIIIIDKKDANFTNCFKNQFAYDYSVIFPHSFRHILSNINKENSNEESRNVELEEIYNASWLFHKNVLFNFILQNLSTGEFAELYREMINHVDFNFGPPEFEHSVKLCEFINLPESVYVRNKRKITIYV